MDLSDKCGQFEAALRLARARNRLFCSRAITQAAGRPEQEGVFANPVVFPAVPSGRARVRISLMATHAEDQLRTAVEKFPLVGKELRII